MVTSNWTSLGAPGNLSANPSVGKNADGRLEAFVWTVGVDAPKALWHIWQTAPGGTWGNWFSSGVPLTGLVLESNPTIAENRDGRLEVFAIGSDQALWHIWQVAPNGTWSNWASLGQPPGTVSSNAPIVSQNQDGRLEIFAIGSDQAFWHIWQTAPGGTWSNWASLGQPLGTEYTTTAIVSQNQDGRLEVFAIGSDQALWHIWQTAPGGTWGNWFSSGGPAVGNIYLLPLVRKNQDGRLEVFVTVESYSGTSTTGTLWHIWQVAPNGTWSNWALLGIPSTTNNISSPSVGKNQDGRLEVFVIGADGALWHIWQTTSGGTWGSWASLGAQSSSVKVIGDPFVTENGDGRLEAFAVGSDGALWHTWQVSPGGSWGS